MNYNLFFYFFISFIFLFLLYFIIYLFLVYPLYRLDKIQTKDEIKKMTELVLLGVTDKSKLSELTNIHINNIELSFFYNYFFFKTPQYTIWCIINKHHKFTNNGNIVLYYYDKINNYTEQDILYINFENFKTYLKNGNIILEYSNNYKQEINFNENKMNVYISTNKNVLNVELNIDEYNTTVPSFLKRYKLANNFSSTGFIETNTVNEWASDNPLIGKINGYFNNDTITGNYWFDNFTGSNNFFLSEYYWFVILNDDWLIYILFYGKYENMNTDIPKVLFIKNRKTNKIFHCSPGVVPNGFKTIDRIVHPIDIHFESSKHIGDTVFDDYKLLFKSNEITININSIKNKSVRTVLYDYYNDPKLNKTKIKNEWDKKYIAVLDNLQYVEYVNRVNVEIFYENKTERFEEDQIVDSIFVKNNLLPSTIKA